MDCGSLIGHDDVVLVTGAAGFIGCRLVAALLARGFRHVRCLVRPGSNLSLLEPSIRSAGGRLDLLKGNLLSRADCLAAATDAAAIFHLAAGRGEKSFPDSFLNTVVTTRNLLDAARQQSTVRRFVSISSFAVYSNRQKPHRGLLDESCPVEARPHLRGDPYCFSKVKQEALVREYCERFSLPYVIVRPGYVYGPGKHGITGRVGIDTFGIFLHLGGANLVPFTFVDNCADAILRAGTTSGVDGEVFNVVDDDLPSSRQFLRMYKQQVRRIRSIYLPHLVSYALCWMWERYASWSRGQLPPTFNRMVWHAYWKHTRYSNDKLKTRLGWRPEVPTIEGFSRYFESCREQRAYA